MPGLSPALDAAFLGDAVLAFGAVEIVLPAVTVHLLDGAGSVTFGGATFVGEDPVYGTLANVATFNDGFDQQAPTTTVVVMPPTNTAAAHLAQPDAQGGRVTIWVGAVNPLTGQVIGDPSLRFIGSIDVPTLNIDANTRNVSFAVISAFEQFFTDNEGVRLSDAYHQALYPGETGLDGVTGVSTTLSWGADAPTPAVTTGAVGGGGGVGGGVGGFSGLQAF